MTPRDQICVHVERIRGQDATPAVSQALVAAFEACPRRRPVAVLNATDDAAVVSGSTHAIAMSGRRPAAATENLVSLRPRESGPPLQLPESWIGSVLVVAARLDHRKRVEPTRHALATLARAAGLRGRPEEATRAGRWLGQHAFASVVVVVHGAGRICTAVLPKDTRAPAVLDAWLTRRLGAHATGPFGHGAGLGAGLGAGFGAGLGVRCRGRHGRGTWAPAKTLSRRLSCARHPRERP